MEITIGLVLVVICALMVFLLVKLISKPFKWAAKLFINGIVGFVSLFFVNFLGGYIGLSLGVNWINAIVVGVLGLPGVVLLLLLKYIF